MKATELNLKQVLRPLLPISLLWHKPGGLRQGSTIRYTKLASLKLEEVFKLARQFRYLAPTTVILHPSNP